MPSRVKKLPLTAALNVRMRNRLNCSNGNAIRRRMQPIAGDQRQRNRQAAPEFRRVLSVCSPNISSTYDSSAMPEPNRMSPTISSGLGSLFAIIGQMQIDHQQTDEADRNIHEKDESPMKVSDDQTAGDRSQHGADQSREWRQSSWRG